MKHCTWDCSAMHLARHAETAEQVAYCTNAEVRACHPVVDLWQHTRQQRDRFVAPVVLTTWGRPCLVAENGRQLRLGEVTT